MIENIKRFLLFTIGRLIPSDLFSRRYPISIKGLLYVKEKVVLLKNERGEWDLPGGKIVSGENVKFCLVREIREELGLETKILDHYYSGFTFVYNKIAVFISVYNCEILNPNTPISLSFEHSDYGYFTSAEIKKLKMNEVLREVILRRIT